jgi:crotonobetainyl-CoA:carnitine CoA-transferase CaiB-like acyl-CoA transferase
MSSLLSTLRILDFSTLLPGPYATMLMADMGAQVTRITHPTKPDLTETLPPFINGTSALYEHLNRGKEILKLDLKSKKAIDQIKALLNDIDIVIEQFRPGVMKKFGLDYDALKALKPDLIYCSITGYGQTGPYSNKAGHDINYLAISGIASYSGHIDHGPTLNGIQIADIAGGSHHAVIGILAAIIHKQQTGEGQYIDISMTDCAFSLNIISGAPMLAGGKEPESGKELLNGGFFYDYYPTMDGRYISVGGLEPQFIKRLAELLECPELLTAGRSTSREAQTNLKRILKDTFLHKSFNEWREIFKNEDVCVEPVLTLGEAIEHPQIKARKLVQETMIKGKPVKQLAFPIKHHLS